MPGELPTEFRIWKSGRNSDRNGFNVLFDDAAARMVMASYEEHGVDVMIDLEHRSLEQESRAYDPDARGWAKLALRNGELWAVDVRWTPDGARRLSEQTQRYVSPAFFQDEDGRPTRIKNIALVAMPATDEIPALVAREAEERMAIKHVDVVRAGKLARKLSKAGLAPSIVIKTLAEGEGDGSGEVAGVDIAGLADFLGITTNPAQDPAGFVKELMAKLDEISGKLRGDEPAAEAPVEEMAAEEEKKDEMAAARLMRDLMGVATFREGVLRLNDWRAIVRDHEAAAAKVASERAAIELTERTALVKRLQALKAETPHTSGLAEGKLCKRLADEPLSALRERVAVLEAAVGARAPHVPQTTSDSTGLSGLSDRELAMCSEMKIDPAQYAATKARRDALRAGKD